MALTFAATLLPVTGPVAQTASVSDWKPGCHIDGHPIDLSFCNTGYLNGHFDGAPNHSFFEEPGAYLNIAIYDSSPQGFRLWGAAGTGYSPVSYLASRRRFPSPPEADAVRL